MTSTKRQIIAARMMIVRWWLIGAVTLLSREITELAILLEYLFRMISLIVTTHMENLKYILVYCGRPY